jgi:dCTP deaminase
MILKSEVIAELLRARTDDPLIITPEPDIEKLKTAGSASVDLRLGTWFVSLRQSRVPYLEILQSTGGSAFPQFTKTHFVPFGEKYYLHPRAFALGTTLEWIRLPRNLFGYVIGRSTWGRRGLIIATATGVHPGFTGCLTLELTNVGELPVEIEPGMSICQIVLHKVDGAADYTDQSAFVGQRRPVLGRVQPDTLADALARSEKD